MTEKGVPSAAAAGSRHRRRRSSQVAGMVALLGAAVLFGWWAGLPQLPRLIPGWPAMQPLAAVCFVLAGLALHLHARRRFQAAAAPLLAIALIAGGGLVQHLGGESLGINTLLFREAVLAQADNPFPGRIYGITAIEFLLFALCLALPRRTRRQYRRVGRLATLGLGLACANLSGYVLNAKGFAGVGNFIPLAAPSAIGLVLLFWGIIQAQRGIGWLCLFRARTSGGQVARHLLPFILGWPLVVGFSINQAGACLGNSQQALALATVVVIVIQAALVLGFAMRLDRAERGRRAADVSLRQSEERYRVVVETAIDGIITTDRHSNIVFANPAAAAIFGYTVAELQAGKLTMLMPERARPAYESALAEYLASGKRHNPWKGVEVGAVHRDGHLIPLEVSYGEFRGNGEPLFIGTVRDISERKRAEAELKDLNQHLEERVRERTAELTQANEALIRSNLEMERFVYIASHDLQTPLRSISSFVQLLQKNYAGKLDAQADGWIDLVIENTHQLRSLFQDLLVYSRADSQALPFEPVDFGRVLDEVVADLAAPLTATGGQVSSGDLPVVMGDRMQLSKMMQNLIDNAVKYHGEAPPRVHVAAERRHGEWLFSVRDNGIGIDPRHHERIFEIFRRLHTLQAYPGTGMGLAVCRRVIERHGGRIWVESEPGKGSVFYFTLPDASQPDAGGSAG